MEISLFADFSNHCIQVLTPELSFSHSFDTKGPAEGQFCFPHDIAFDSKGLLYVADHDDHRIQDFTQEGHYVYQFGTKGSGPGQLNSPVGITINDGLV